MLTDPEHQAAEWAPGTAASDSDSAEATHQAVPPCHDGRPVPQELRPGALLAASLIIDTHTAGLPCDGQCGGDDDCDRLDEALALMVAEQELYRLVEP